ncbi:hypothetical protein V6N13_063921 [Hibiscus sabdariffa]
MLDAKWRDNNFGIDWSYLDAIGETTAIRWSEAISALSEKQFMEKRWVSGRKMSSHRCNVDVLRHSCCRTHRAWGHAYKRCCLTEI